MNIDAYFVDKWITLELAQALSREPQPVGPLFPELRKAIGMYALYFPEHEAVYFGEAGDLEHAKAHHLYQLRCQRHENPAVQQAFNDDPEGKVLFFAIVTSRREQARALLEQFLAAYKDCATLLNNGVLE
jgi:hypothetical protein